MLGAATLSLGAGVTGPDLTYVGNFFNNVNWPYAGIPGLAGDIVVVYCYSNNSSFSTPAGWTTIVNSFVNLTGSVFYYAIFYKIRGATESFPSINASFLACGAVWRPSRTVVQGNILPQNHISQITETTPTNKTLSMSNKTGSYIGLAFYFNSNSTSITTRGSTVTATREINFVASNAMYLKTFENSYGLTPFADSTISMADYGNNWLSVVTLSIP